MPCISILSVVSNLCCWLTCLVTVNDKSSLMGLNTFSFYRSSSFSGAGIVTYDGVNGNNTSGLDLNTGIFEANHPGPYLIAFTSLSPYATTAYAKIVHNGNDVAVLHDSNRKSSHNMMSQTVILDLAVGDRVWIRSMDSSRSLHSNSDKYIQFIGHSL